MALIVKSGLPGNPLNSIRVTHDEATYAMTYLIQECASFYYEPYPGDEGVIVVDPEHAGRVRELKAQYHL